MQTKEIDRAHIQSIYRPVATDSHKGTLGHAIIVGGSYGKMGAISLSAKAALKTGCGLVTAYIPKCGYEILQIAVPEVMTIVNGENYLSAIDFEFSPQAIGIGPGMGRELPTQDALFKFLKAVSVPIVLDADALNILSTDRNWPDLLPKNAVITPHPKEFERLVGVSETESERVEKAIQISMDRKIVIVLKGAPTKIISGNKIFVNTTGNAALATAGSGDVLTGMITSLLAQGYKTDEATKIGVYLHGLTADIALPQTGTQSLWPQTSSIRSERHFFYWNRNEKYHKACLLTPICGILAHQSNNHGQHPLYQYRPAFI